MPLHYLRFPGMQTLHVASCSRRAYPPARRRHQIPIAPVAPPVPNFPRLRALALFGRRPVERAGLSLLPASKNLHNSGSDRPNAEHGAEWQAAMRALLLVSEHDGPAMFARISVIRALNRHVERVFNPSRKEPHWGRRKLARDR